jgi:hypothetical protein
MKEKLQELKTWFFKRRLSWFDFITIVIAVSILNNFSKEIAAMFAVILIVIILAQKLTRR